VAVIGGGAAGLSAALTAAESGRSVILLEKNPQLGGSTVLAIGSMAAAGTSVQRAKGITDSPVAYLADLAKVTPALEPRNNQALREILAAEAAASIERLKAYGISFYGPSPDAHYPVPRMHILVPGTKACIARLERIARHLGCRIETGRPVRELLSDGRGRVTGVVAVDPASGQTERYRAGRGVILACGDYSSSLDLKRRFLADGFAAIEGINPTSTGDGHRLAMEAGAAVVNMDLFHGPELRFIPGRRRTLKDRFQAFPRLAKAMTVALEILPAGFMTHVAKEMLVSWQHPDNSLYLRGAILVNQEGRRFVDETRSPEREIAVAEQPGKIAYLAFDHRVAKQFREWPHFIATAPGIAYAYLDDYRRFRPDIFVQAQTLEGLCDRFAIPAKAFVQTVAAYNAAAAAADADPWGRQTFEAPLAEPPFYLLGPAKAFIPTTDGGVRINTRFEVLREDGSVIEGLYAAGATGQGGLVYASHGLGLAWAFTSGRLAAGRAAGSSPA
jgi:fumarate reductase flavoprotein subunit